MKKIKPNLNAEDRDLMEKMVSAGHIEHKFAARLQAVLLVDKGKKICEIAEFLGINAVTVRNYIKRYNATGLSSLLRDKTRKPGTKPISQEKKNELCRVACTEKPKDEGRGRDSLELSNACQTAWYGENDCQPFANRNEYQASSG